MTNQAGCSYCTDDLYDNQNLCESFGDDGTGDASWNFDTIMDEIECTAANGVYFDGLVGGFQFELLGVTVVGASAPAGFMASTSSTTILAFSLTGATIPAGEGILTQVTFSGFEGANICFGEDTGSSGGTAISDGSGNYIAADWGPCFGGDESIAGCMDMDACNYNPDATEDDASCVQPEENYDCDGNCVVDTDCNGDCGGSAEFDECGICGGDDSLCSDCAGVPNGNSVLDNCDTCDNDLSNDCVQDCAGVWGGSLEYDECGVCDGDGSSCADCDAEVCLSIENVDVDAGTLDIYMTNSFTMPKS
jgi:hypothetical protein